MRCYCTPYTAQADTVRLASAELQGWRRRRHSCVGRSRRGVQLVAYGLLLITTHLLVVSRGLVQTLQSCTARLGVGGQLAPTLQMPGYSAEQACESARCRQPTTQLVPARELVECPRHDTHPHPRSRAHASLIHTDSVGRQRRGTRHFPGQVQREGMHGIITPCPPLPASQDSA
jgi:hypothetical protein